MNKPKPKTIALSPVKSGQIESIGHEGSTSAYPLEARLKYRESGGKLSFWYELIRPDRVFKTAVVDDLQKIKDATGFPIVFGTP